MFYSHESTQGYWISKAEFDRLSLRFDGSGVYSRQPRIADNAELRALAGYSRAVNKLLLAWKAISTAFHQEIDHRNGDTALQRQLDRLDALLEQAQALIVPDRAAAVQRLLITMLRSERAYFQSVFDDVDDMMIGEHAADFQEEAARFLVEFNRLARICGQ